MTGLKYQPSKASEANIKYGSSFSICLLKCGLPTFLFGGMESVGNLSCLMMDVIPIIVDFFFVWCSETPEWH